MSVHTPRFHWWYLLLLLPVVGYFAADWYVGHRIDRAIAQANGDGNKLEVADYSYGFFPPSLSARGIAFDQDRSSLAARGNLRHLELNGLDLLSLLGDDPIAIDRLSLSGLELTATRKTTTDTTTSSSTEQFGLRIGQLSFDSTFVDLTTARGQQFAADDLAFAVSALHLPLALDKLQEVELAARQLSYRDASDSTEVTATDISYQEASRGVLIEALTARRGNGTDLTARDILLSGLNRERLDQTIQLDSLRIAYLGGRAQVKSSSGQAEPAVADTAGSRPALHLGTLQLPDIELSVAGDFGTTQLTGALSLDRFALTDTLTIANLTLEGDSLSYLKGDRTLTARNTKLEQAGIHLPLGGTAGTDTVNGTLQLGRTELRIDQLTAATGGTTVTSAPLVYDSERRSLSGQDIRVDGPRLTARLSTLEVQAIDREALLSGRPPSAAAAELTGLSLEVRNRDGGSYRVGAPALTLTDLRAGDGLRIARTEVTNATVVRRGKSGKEDLRATGIYVDQYGITTPLRPAELGESKLRVDRVSLNSEAQPVDYNLHNIAYSSRIRRLTIDSLNRRNRLSAAAFFGQRVAKSYLRFDFDGLRAMGIDHTALLRGERVAVDSLRARDFQLSVIEDISLELPGEPQPKNMPIEALRKLGIRVVLDDAQFSSTDISYGVIDSMQEPKAIHFNQGTVRLRGLDTAPSTTDSVVATIDATFERSTPMHAEFILARDESGRNYAIRGELGQYDLSGINPLFKTAADAVVETGIIDRMTYRGRMQDDVVEGEMTLLYRNLALDLVGGGAWIKNLVSGLVLKDDNQEGEDFRQGRMYHEHDVTKSFFNAYWKGLVSGMKSSALADIALPGELD